MLESTSEPFLRDIKLVQSRQQYVSFPRAVEAVEAGQSPSSAAQLLLSQLSKSERLWLLDGDDPFFSGLRTILCNRYNHEPFVHGAIPRLAIPGIKFTDGPRGVVMGHSTAFPVAMARGATWDTSLERRIGNAIGIEAKAQGANYFAGVCVNLPRHPAWGRIQETYSEDPLLLGEFGLALTEGVQRHVMACVKHFALNSMENARFKVDVLVEDDVLHEVYLPHFRRIIEGGVASVMSSYNSVNGEWAGQSKKLLTQILRNDWQFDGFVISDFIFGLRDASLSLQNGLDIEAPFRQQREMHLLHELNSGRLAWADVDRAGVRILGKQLEFAVKTKKSKPDLSRVFCEEHRELAREAAGRSMVLLKNEQVRNIPLLPLEAQKISGLAVIGRLANTASTGDKGSSQVFPPSVVTPVEGLRNALPRAKVVCDSSDCAQNAARVAAEVDVAVCIVGYDAADEGEYVVPSLQSDSSLLELFPDAVTQEERRTLAVVKGSRDASATGRGLEVGAGGDRRSLRLRDQDVAIIKAVAQANPCTIVAIIAAGTVIIEEWKNQVPAIILSWYAGSEGGHALADVLLGHIDASGRLPFSIPTTEAHLPFFDIDASQIRYDRWHGQHLLDKLGVPAAYPMGFGLSYTSFRLDNLRVDSLNPVSHAKAIFINVTITNTGPRQGRFIAQVYGLPNVHDFPYRLLLGFEPVDLNSGESRKLRIRGSLQPLQRWRDGKFTLPGGEIQIEVGAYAGHSDSLRANLMLPNSEALD